MKSLIVLALKNDFSLVFFVIPLNSSLNISQLVEHINTINTINKINNLI